MTLCLSDFVTPRISLATDSEARLLFFDASTSGGEVAGLHGTLDGPHCIYARSLPTEFRLNTRRDPTGAASAEALITDPCYWTPALPFLYNLAVELELADGSSTTVRPPIALRRWHADDVNLRLERKRIVLRGSVVPGVDATTISAARQAEATIVVHNPGDDFCHEASRRGVALIADLRGLRQDLTATLRRLSWQPAIMIAVLDCDTAESQLPMAPPLLANAISAEAAPATGDASWAEVIVIELALNERPPAWLSSCGKPAIAIRRGAAYADLQAARGACDRLQAELAPEFNLAGYFVSST